MMGRRSGIAFTVLLTLAGCSKSAPPPTPQEQISQPRATPPGPAIAEEQAQPASVSPSVPTAGCDALRDAWKTIDAAAMEDVSRAPSGAALEAIVPLLPAVHEECKAGSGVACWLYHYEYERFLRLARSQAAQTQPRLGAMCEQDNQVACALVADALDNPMGGAGAASSGLRRACDAGLTDACARAAILRLTSGVDGDGMTKEQAHAMRSSACERGFLSGCRIVPALLGAYSDDFDQTPNYAPTVKSCSVGLLEDCERLLRSLKPSRFGCDQCTPKSMDSRCTECEIVACIEQNCCDTCEHRDSAPCCVEWAYNTPKHPKHAPALDRSRADRIIAAADAAIEPLRALLVLGCEQGHAAMCQADRLQQAVGGFSSSITKMTEG